MTSIRRLLMMLSFLALAACITAPLAAASTTQQSIIEDDVSLHTNMIGTLATMQRLGVTLVKVDVDWASIAPASGSFHEPKKFDARNPAAYPAANWSYYDNVVKRAQLDGLQVGFMLTGPGPLWATGPGMPPRTAGCPCGQWKPSDRDFQAFAQAVGERYDGAYTPKGVSVPLPRVSWWSIWNEPNYGPNLAPQAIDDDTVEVGALEYRGLLNAAWKGLAASGHTTAGDTILIGETAPRGLNHPIGNFSGVKPLRFLRALYCVSSSYQELRGSAAATRACPTTAAGSRGFRAANPALFQASGFADHPYEQGTPPDQPTYACGSSFCWNPYTLQSDPEYADFPEIPRLERTLDRLNAVYGSRTQFQIWNTEYGWWTNPPDTGKGSLPQATVAYYMNWAEYMSYNQPRLVSYDQYLLVDPADGKFASGLELSSGKPLATFDAFELPLYMPTVAAKRASSLVVWGAARRAPSAGEARFSALAASGLVASGLADQVQIQFQAGSRGRFSTVQTVTITSPRGYFEVRQAVTRSGSVRLAWSSAPGATVYSRTVKVSIG
ncbi:MAG: hypothetical protein ACLP22_21180 [Solirubrobacteraceae bacterium]